MLNAKSEGKKISGPIVLLSTIGIALGVAVMILSISISTGFQTEIKNKVVGFGSHMHITNEYSNNSYESTPMSAEPFFLEDLRENEKIESVEEFAYKPAIIQSRSKESKGEKEIREILGLVFKGIGADFNKKFLQQNLVSGVIPSFEKQEVNDSILISQVVAKKMKLQCGDKLSVFFNKTEGPISKNLVVSGIFETGLEDFDKQFAFADINHIKMVNEWGIQTHLQFRDQCIHGLPVVEAVVRGGNGDYLYKWGDSEKWTRTFEVPICPIQDTTIRVIASDFDAYSMTQDEQVLSIPDTAWMKIHVDSVFTCPCDENYSEFETDVDDEGNLIYKIRNSKIRLKEWSSGGSHPYYTGGYEVMFKDYESLLKDEKIVYDIVGFTYNSSSIGERNPEIFNWLNMLDMNVYIIIGLMILVAIINMTSALLVLILEKTRMIGILKALGAQNWSIRKVFLWMGGRLIIKGLIYGNALALLVILLQNQLQIFTLPQENYYVSVVPMYYELIPVVIINLGAFAISVFALILPSYMVTKISPVKAIKFD